MKETLDQLGERAYKAKAHPMQNSWVNLPRYVQDSWIIVGLANEVDRLEAELEKERPR